MQMEVGFVKEDVDTDVDGTDGTDEGDRDELGRGGCVWL